MMATLRSDMDTPKKPAAGPSGTRGANLYLPARGGRSHEVRSGGVQSDHPTPAARNMLAADPPLRGGRLTPRGGPMGASESLSASPRPPAASRPASPR